MNKNYRHYLHHVMLTTMLLVAATHTDVCAAAECDEAATALVVQSEYPELPPLRPGAKYSSRMENVRRIAFEDEQNGAIPSGSYQRVVSSLTPQNVLYQTDPEGQDVASIPLIAAMIDNDATLHGSKEFQHIFDEAYHDGMEFTPRLMEIISANGLYLFGLENAVKAASHIVDKANRWVSTYRRQSDNPEATPEEAAHYLNDLVRYSAETTKENYVEGTLALINSLRENGYEVLVVNNRYLDQDGKENLQASYRSVHVTVKIGERLIEIQIHDHSSQYIRESTHEIYEKMRKLSRDSEEYQRLNEQMLVAWQSYQNPAGIERIKNQTSN